MSAAAWWAAVEAAPAEPVGVSIDPFAPAGIAYTSGTTGHPKGAVHSQHNLLVPGAVLVESRGYDASLRKGDCFPFTVLNMAVLTTLLVSQAGGCSIVMDRIDAEGVAEWIRTERVTTWNGPPALLHSLATNDAVAAVGSRVARRGVDRGGRLPRADPFHVRGQVRPSGARHLRAQRGADRGGHRSSEWAPRGWLQRAAPAAPGGAHRGQRRHHGACGRDRGGLRGRGRRSVPADARLLGAPRGDGGARWSTASCAPATSASSIPTATSTCAIARAS